MRAARRAAVLAASLSLVGGACLVVNQLAGSTSSRASLSSGALPPEVAGSAPASGPTTGPTVSPPATTAAVPTPAQTPGVPVAIDIPFRSLHYPDGVHASVSADPLNADGSLFVPADPRAVSWARQDAAPGNAHGTTILTSHINFVIDGTTVAGAFVDLADYAHTDIGKELSVLLADGRRLKYRIVAGREYNKDRLAGDRALRTSLYNQADSFGLPGQPRTGRLLLVSCGGAFDTRTGEYEDNVFVYALPVIARAGAVPGLR